MTGRQSLYLWPRESQVQETICSLSGIWIHNHTRSRNQKRLAAPAIADNTLVDFYPMDHGPAASYSMDCLLSKGQFMMSITDHCTQNDTYLRQAYVYQAAKKVHGSNVKLWRFSTSTDHYATVAYHSKLLLRSSLSSLRSKQPVRSVSIWKLHRVEWRDWRIVHCAAFSGLRVFALWGHNYFLLLVVSALGLAPVVSSLVSS